MKKWCLNYYLVSIFLIGVENANAGLVDAGLDPEITSKYVIDASLSSASYLDKRPFLQDQGLSGSFNVNFLHAYYTYDVDNDFSTSEDRFVVHDYGVLFHNPNISLQNGLPADLQFPIYTSFSVEPNSSDSLRDNSVCSVPYGLCNQVFDFNQYEIPKLSGLIKNGKIIIDGSQPNAQGGYTYHIEAYVVPVPAAFWLFASALGVFAKWTRTKSKIS